MFGFNSNNNEKITLVVDDAVLKQAQTLDLVGAIDQGTSSTRFVVFTKRGRIAASAQMEHTQHFPPDHVGWHEHDPIEFWQNVMECIDAVAKELKHHHGIDLGGKSRRLKAVGITNQRETTIAWNAETGIPYYNAIVWDDLRTTDIAASIAHGDVNRFRLKTGLPLASYFAGTKVKWLLDNVPALQADFQDPNKREQVRFGTVDTWLLYQLTGRPSNSNVKSGEANVGGVFVTDVTNASRWLFLNLQTIRWDEELVNDICAPHSLPLSALPTIMSSSQVYATCTRQCGVVWFDQVPIASILGDQQVRVYS